MRKRSIRIAAVAVLLCVLFLFYQWGMLHAIAAKLASAAGIEWNVSAPQTIGVHFPRWACGEAQPPYLLVETDDAASAALIGTHIRIVNDETITYHDYDEHFFAECQGRFKTSLAMLIREHSTLRLEGWNWDCGGAGITGRFFEADSCRALKPSLDQIFKTNELMKPYNVTLLE